MTRKRGAAAAALASALGCLPPVAVAAPPAARYVFRLPAQSYVDSLIAVGETTRISVLNVAACKGTAPALTGRMTAEQALRRLLRDAPCHVDFLDPATARLTPGRAAPPAVAPPAPPPIARAATAPPSPPPAAVDEVVVTAGKRPERLLRTAGGVSVVAAARVTDVGAVDVNDVVAQLSSVAITNLGPGRDKLLLRGVSDGAFTGRARSTVATYLGDAPITYNAPDPDLVLTDVDRIEIVRGPQGALYGGGSIGGVYRAVPHAPDLTAYSGEARLRGALTQRGAGSDGLELTLNAPLMTDRAAVRFVAYHLDDGGYLQDQSLRSANVDQTERTGGRAALLLQLGPKWTLQLSGAAQHLRTADTQYTTLGGGTLKRANLLRESHKNDFADLAVTLEGKLDDLTLHSTTSGVRHDFTSRYDASAALSLFDAPAAEFGAYDETVRSTLIAQDLYLTSPQNRPVSWLFGAFLSHQDEHTPSALSARVSGGGVKPVTLYDESRRDHIDEKALYGDVTVRLARRWTLDLGARVFRTAVDVHAVTDARGVPERLTNGAKLHASLSPRLSLQYAAGAQTTVYVLASEGERAGGVNSGGLRAPSVAQRSFSADRLWNYEGGVKTALWNRRLELQTTLFHQEWRNIQTDQFYSSGLPFTANIGDGRITGVEGHALVRLTPRLTVEGEALATTSGLVKANPLYTTNLGKDLPGAPSTAATLYVVYDHPLAPDLTLRLNGRASYVGRSRVSYDVTAVDTMSGAYVDAMIGAQLVTRRYRLALLVRNPADTRADTFAYGNPFSFGQVRQSTPQRPRTVELVLSAGF